MNIFSELAAKATAEVEAVSGAIVADTEAFFGGLEPELKADATAAWGVVRNAFTDAAGNFLPTLYAAVKNLISAGLAAAVTGAVTGGDPIAMTISAIETEAPAVMKAIGKAAVTSVTGAIASTMPQLKGIAETADAQVTAAAEAAMAAPGMATPN